MASRPVDQGPSSLDYSSVTALVPNRLGFVEQGAGAPPEGDFGFAVCRRTSTRSAFGERLEQPREILEPGAWPEAVCFVDYSILMPGWIFVHYLKTRSDRQGRGLATAAIMALVEANPDIEVLDFGKLMSEAANAVRLHVQDALPSLYVRYKLWF